MKKGVLLTGLVVSALLVTGCGGAKERNLNCTMKEEANGATTTSVMDINFKGNQAENITLDMTIDYSDELKEYASVFKQTLEAQRKSLESVGYEVEITSEENSQKLTAKGTSKTLDESESKGSYSATKKSLEDAGYICK